MPRGGTIFAKKGHEIEKVRNLNRRKTPAYSRVIIRQSFGLYAGVLMPSTSGRLRIPSYRKYGMSPIIPHAESLVYDREGFDIQGIVSKQMGDWSIGDDITGNRRPYLGKFLFFLAAP